MKNISRFIAVTVLMLSAVVAFAQNDGSGYKVLNGKVYYNNVILQDADPHTIQDLGYGYAKDLENVWLEGKLLPLVDARSFTLRTPHHSSAPHGPTPPPPPPADQSYGLDDLLSDVFGIGQGKNPGHKHDHPDHHKPVHQERGYEVIGTKVYYNGQIVSGASSHTFKDLGFGYAKDSKKVYYCGKSFSTTPSRFVALTDGYAMDSFDVYYFGKKIGASTAGFKVLSDGYAKDAFDAYYCGKEVVGSTASSFKVTGNGYAQDNWAKYYLGKKIK